MSKPRRNAEPPSAGAGRRPAASAAPPQGAPGEVRIIGGAWRRSRLPVPARPGLRPTPDRVRETLFNWLGQDLAGWRCVDAFSGSGVLALEAASRGAAEVLAIERDPGLAAQIEAHGRRLGATALRVRTGDALRVMAELPLGGTDLVFVDPPFSAGLFEPALRLAAPLLCEGGWIYLESPEAWDTGRLTPLGLARHRHLKAGAVHAHLIVRAPPPEGAPTA